MNSPQDRLLFNNKWELADYLSGLINKAEAYIETSQMLNEAHEYVQKYCMKEGWGRNVWHTVLKDAIRMREEQNATK